MIEIGNEIPYHEEDLANEMLESVRKKERETLYLQFFILDFMGRQTYETYITSLLEDGETMVSQPSSLTLRTMPSCSRAYEVPKSCEYHQCLR